MGYAVAMLALALRSTFLTGLLALGTACGGTQAASEAGGSGGGSSSSSSGGEGGEGGEGPVDCDESASPKEQSCLVDDAYGIFVSSALGDDKNDGSKMAPVKSLAVAIDKAKFSAKGRVFACSEEFIENIELPESISLFGGLDCRNAQQPWTWGPVPSILSQPVASIQPPLLLTEGMTRTVADFEFRAQEGVFQKDAWEGHSVAVFAVEATARFERCAFNTADGSPGANGEDGSSSLAPAEKGVNGNPGLEGQCGHSISNLAGGAAVENPACKESVGGKGGDASIVYSGGKSGDAGLPQDGLSGEGGVGQPAMGLWSCNFGGTGEAGAAGQVGEPGSGGAGDGMLSAAGFVGSDGTAGLAGKPGQGGGGGGVSRATSSCGPDINYYSASGGSGGSGGCGGLGGGGGLAGGSSVGLLSFNSTLVLVDSDFKTGAGGAGGDGGSGQPGGDGGFGGNGRLGYNQSNDGFSCSGGQGGPGGGGGVGGGGRGGHAAGILYTGDEPLLEGGQNFELGKAGPGGASDASGVGAEGLALNSLGV